MTANALTVSEKLILAAADLESGGTAPFAAEDLVVRAWELFPDTFGLAGYNDRSGQPRFPDSNRVFSEIMGSKPIRKRGLLQKVGRKKYTLTQSGRDFARLLATRGTDAPQKSGLSRDFKQDLRRLLGSRAVEKYTEGREDDITFYDACAFWGISPRSSAMNLAARTEHVRAMVETASTSLGGADEQLLKHGGEVLSRRDLERLETLQDFMQEKFKEELAVISARTDER